MSAFEEFDRLLRQRVDSFFALTVEQSRALHAHYEILARWNKVLNLTRIESLEAAVERHYAESLFLAAHLAEDVGSIVDIGSGAGFPGFPVAVARPDMQVVLLESDQRKAAFLRECTDLARNARVVAERAEHLKGSFDAVIARAVRPKDVAKVARRVARSVALLVSRGDATALDFQQARILDFPWGGGVLYVGDVPRGTSGVIA